jgi:2-keto-4-pentenoate hydratase/2-oxohepta-3-ene-1,7-dioic acid hydratase in catechol pathway
MSSGYKLDLILTGTPSGVGLARKEFLKAGEGMGGRRGNADEYDGVTIA